MIFKSCHIVWRADRVELTTTDAATQTLSLSEKTGASLLAQIKNTILSHPGWTLLDEFTDADVGSSKQFNSIVVQFDMANGYPEDNPIFRFSTSSWWSAGSTEYTGRVYLYVQSVTSWDAVNHVCPEGSNGLSTRSNGNHEWASGDALGFTTGDNSNACMRTDCSSDMFFSVGDGWWNAFPINSYGAEGYPFFGCAFVRDPSETESALKRYGVHVPRSSGLSAFNIPGFRNYASYTYYTNKIVTVYDIARSTNGTTPDGKKILIPWYVTSAVNDSNYVEPIWVPSMVPNIRTAPSGVGTLIGTMIPSMSAPEWILTGDPNDSGGLRFAMPWNIPA